MVIVCWAKYFALVCNSYPFFRTPFKIHTHTLKHAATHSVLNNYYIVLLLYSNAIKVIENFVSTMPSHFGTFGSIHLLFDSYGCRKTKNWLILIVQTIVKVARPLNRYFVKQKKLVHPKLYPVC